MCTTFLGAFDCGLIEEVRPVLRVRRRGTTGADSVSSVGPDVLLPPRQDLLQLRAAAFLQNSNVAVRT